MRIFSPINRRLNRTVSANAFINHPSTYETGGVEMVNVSKVGEKYRCNVCGNEVTVTNVGGGELVCCGQPMELIG